MRLKDVHNDVRSMPHASAICSCSPAHRRRVLAQPSVQNSDFVIQSALKVNFFLSALVLAPHHEAVVAVRSRSLASTWNSTPRAIK
jgi:hypothetical protein